MSDGCYECQGLRREKKAAGWVIAGLVILSVISMGTCVSKESKLSATQLRADRLEETKGAPIQGATGSFRVTVCDATEALCVLSPLKDEEDHWGGQTRLYAIVVDTHYGKRPAPDQILALEEGKVVGLADAIR